MKGEHQARRGETLGANPSVATQSKQWKLDTKAVSGETFGIATNRSMRFWFIEAVSKDTMVIEPIEVDNNYYIYIMIACRTHAHHYQLNLVNRECNRIVIIYLYRDRDQRYLSIPKEIDEYKL